MPAASRVWVLSNSRLGGLFFREPPLPSGLSTSVEKAKASSREPTSPKGYHRSWTEKSEGTEEVSFEGGLLCCHFQAGDSRGDLTCYSSPCEEAATISKNKGNV